jgi:hypothetical protein
MGYKSVIPAGASLSVRSTNGGVLSVLMRPIEKGQRARTEADAFSAEVDVICAKADQFLVHVMARVKHHTEIAYVLDELCKQANSLMDEFNEMDNGLSIDDNQMKILRHLVENIKLLKMRMSVTRKEISSISFSLPEPGRGISYLPAGKSNSRR